MRAIYYNTADRWGDYWLTVKEDKSKLDINSYPIFPAIEHIKNDGLILEAGCGLGRLAKWLKENNFKVVAMELEEYSVQKLKKDAPSMDCVRADACSLPFRERSFRYVFLMGVIDVFSAEEKRESSLDEAERVLDNQGTAFISVPHADSLFWLLYSLRRNNFIRKIFGRRKLQQHIGQFAFTTKEVKSLVQRHFSSFKVNYANCRMGFFYIFPFLRAKKIRKDNFPELQKRERSAGDKIYELNRFGEFLFLLLKGTGIFNKFISPTLYVVARK